VTGGDFAFTDLAGGYGAGIVVRGVSATVSPGQVLCVLGRNGVGKSTLLKLLMGYLRPARGSVTFAGQELTAAAPLDHVRRGITYCPQERVVFDDLTVAENLTLMRRSRGLDGFARYFAAFPRLKERLRQHAGTLSGGEKKLLSLARGLAEERPVVLLDEPSEGVQFENVQRMAELVIERAGRGATFIIVEQNLTFVESIANEILVMDHGECVLSGRAAGLERSDILRHLAV
jgi:branched-chain amino acid transport system ATP-binding protein